MTFTVTPKQFAGLKQQLADSHQVAMTVTVAAVQTNETGVITYGNIQADYSYSAPDNKLAVSVVKGGNLVVNHVLNSRLQQAIDSIPPQ
jgi:hypothetical protein